MRKKYNCILVAVLALMAFSLGSGYDLDYPDYFPTPVYDFNKNQITEEKVAVGRALFYDPILSKDSTISCASCHSPFNAFAHTDHDLSHGIRDQMGTRNAPALFNLAWQKSFMWDGAINHLDMQALAPISHEKEMDESMENIAKKLQRHSFYPRLFDQAFGDSTVTGELVLKALSQFQLTLISAGSKYDQVKSKLVNFTEQEEKGYVLFKQNCNTCHTEPLFSNYDFKSNGLSVDTTLNDFGKWGITKKTQDSLLFKVPTLRNLSFTYPYMHDGRFKRLGQVLNHYTKGMNRKGVISEELKETMDLSSNEKTDLVAFLLTLNDTSFVFNPKHQFPKKNYMKSKGIEK